MFNVEINQPLRLRIPNRALTVREGPVTGMDYSSGDPTLTYGAQFIFFKA